MKVKRAKEKKMKNHSDVHATKGMEISTRNRYTLNTNSLPKAPFQN